jgi:ubiquinone/menaquinone biosynthesis C-methylase UbiE
MELSKAIDLIKHKNISNAAKTTWADMGCGSGLFTVALSNLLAPGSIIYAIDKNALALKKLHQPNNIIVEKLQADFIQDHLNLGNLDGILMANSIHFAEEKISFIYKLRKYLKANGSFVIVEYDTDISNQWVPFPISYHSLQRLFTELGYRSFHKIHESPSRYQHANIYSVLITV